MGLRPEARTLGLTVEELTRQAPAAFFGVEALRVQRNREEVPVYARTPVTGQRETLRSAGPSGSDGGTGARFVAETGFVT